MNDMGTTPTPHKQATTCPRCLDGRHVRCGGRGGCACTSCLAANTRTRVATVSVKRDRVRSAVKRKARRELLKQISPPKVKVYKPTVYVPTGRPRGGQRVTFTDPSEVRVMVLARENGLSISEIARRLGTSRDIVRDRLATTTNNEERAA